MRTSWPAHPEVPISQVAKAGDFVFTSALGPWTFDPGKVRFADDGTPLSDGSGLEDTPFAEQVHRTFAAISSALARAGATLDDVVDCQCWLADARDFVAFNAIYETYFAGNRPTRSVFPSAFMFCCKVEIKVVAYCLQRGA